MTSKRADIAHTNVDAADLRLLEALQRDALMSNQALGDAAHVAAATAHRRVRRLQDIGVIERSVALLSPDRLAQLGQPVLQALVEITLDVQTHEKLDAFERHAIAEVAVQQCWRVSPGPDFVLVIAVRDMAGYQDFAARFLTGAANVRNVRAFFSVKRSKFGAELPLAP